MVQSHVQPMLVKSHLVLLNNDVRNPLPPTSLKVSVVTEANDGITDVRVC